MTEWQAIDDENPIDGWLHRRVARLAREMVPALIDAEMARRQRETAILTEHGLCICATCGSVLGEHRHERKPLITEIAALVSKDFGIAVADLFSERRNAAVARPRQVAMFMARHLTNGTMEQIARAFRRDHTTVMHGIDRVAEAMSHNAAFSGRVRRLMSDAAAMNDALAEVRT